VVAKPGHIPGEPGNEVDMLRVDLQVDQELAPLGRTDAKRWVRVRSIVVTMCACSEGASSLLRQWSKRSLSTVLSVEIQARVSARRSWRSCPAPASALRASGASLVRRRIRYGYSMRATRSFAAAA